MSRGRTGKHVTLPGNRKRPIPPAKDGGVSSYNLQNLDELPHEHADVEHRGQTGTIPRVGFLAFAALGYHVIRPA